MKFISLLAPSALAYSLCDPAQYPYKGQNVSAELVQTATRVLILNDLTSSIPFLSGTIQVVDGCTFEVKNLNFNASPVFNFEWYGAFKDGGDQAISLSSTPLLSSTKNAAVQTFTFKRIAGAAVSYKDFNQFRLFETKSKSVVATADLPPNPQVVNSGNSTSSSGSNPSPTGSGTDAVSTPKSGNNGDIGLAPASAIVAAVIMIMIA